MVESAKIENNSQFSEVAADLTNILQESVSKFTAGDHHIRRARALRGKNPDYDSEVWRSMAELGWLGTLVPESYGGMGLGCAAMSVIAETLGRSLFPEPLVGAVVLAGGTVLYGDNDALKRKLLPAMVAGELIPALAWREQGGVGDPLTVETQVAAKADGLNFSGVKQMILGGAAADGFVVTARSPDGIGLYWVPREKVTSAISMIELADGRLAAQINLTGVSVPTSHRIAGPGTAEAALVRAYDEALIMTAAELLGVLSRAFEITLDYLRTRVQFGKLIGSFQALQHRAVDLYMVQRMCRHALDDVTRTISEPGITPNARGALASRIKARCSAAGLQVTREAIQMHGAIGFSDECDIGMYLKRAITLAGWLGGANFHRRRFANLAPHDAEKRARLGRES